MKFSTSPMPILCLSLLVAGTAMGTEPAPCSISVGVVTQFGAYRTWTNALETQILADKGLSVCQDDAILNLSDEDLANLDEEKAAKLLKCRTEFHLELLFRKDNTTRNLTVTKNGQEVFDRDYPPKNVTLGSLKILKTLPTCADLQASFESSNSGAK